MFRTGSRPEDYDVTTTGFKESLDNCSSIIRELPSNIPWGKLWSHGTSWMTVWIWFFFRKAIAGHLSSDIVEFTETFLAALAQSWMLSTSAELKLAQYGLVVPFECHCLTVKGSGRLIRQTCSCIMLTAESTQHLPGDSRVKKRLAPVMQIKTWQDTSYVYSCSV